MFYCTNEILKSLAPEASSYSGSDAAVEENSWTISNQNTPKYEAWSWDILE